jgi:hypothetical protein
MTIFVFTLLPEIVQAVSSRSELTNGQKQAVKQLREQLPKEWSELHIGGVSETWEGGSAKMRPERESLIMARVLGINPRVAKLTTLLSQGVYRKSLLLKYLAGLPDRSIVITDSLVAMRLMEQEVGDGSVFRLEINRKKGAPAPG